MFLFSLLVLIFIALYSLRFVRGSFAVVRIGVSNKTKAKFAIKEIYTPDFTTEQIEDLNKEINILSQLRHHNIVRLYEVYKDNKSTYMV